MAAPLMVRPTSEEETVQVKEFRASDEFAAMADEFHDSTLMQEANHDDRLIVRFLRARNHDVKEASKMFRNMLKWRREFGTDQASSWKFSSVDKVKELFPHGFHKCGKSGMPVYIIRIGLLNATELLDLYDVPELVRLHVQLREYCRTVLYPRASRRANATIDQQITIFDVKGASLSLMSRKVYQYIQETSFIDQNYYPEILCKMFIVNAPLFFSVVWKVVSPWIEERVHKKISISRSLNENELLEVVDSNSLPDFLSGTDKSFMNSEEEREARCYAMGQWPSDAILLSETSLPAERP